MKIPTTYNNMKLVKCYENYALYKNEYYRECFSYYELGVRTKQLRNTKQGHFKENCFSFRMRKFIGGTEE